MLARVSIGEYVLRAAAVSAYGTDYLDQMNSLQVPAFAVGGPVLDVAGPSQMFGSGRTVTEVQSGSTTAALERKVDGLIDVVKQIVGPMKIDSDANAKLFKKWDTVGVPTKAAKSASTTT